MFGKSLLVSAAALASLLVAGCSAPPQRPETLSPGDYGYARHRLQWEIGRTMAEQKIVGLSIALVDGRRIVWAEGFGKADRARSVPAGARTRYRTGSLSKLFTATAVLQLVERGALELDRPLTDYLPGFSIGSRFPAAGPVTPRLLLTHHSGLPATRDKGMWSRRPASFTRLVDEIRDEYLAQPPGEVLAYSNLGYSLLGHAVQAVAGEPFADYVQRAVLRPMGARDAGFSRFAPSGAGAAAAYRAADGEAVTPYGLRDVPAGGLNASVLDLGRFLQMLFGDGRGAQGRVLTSGSVAEMLSVQNAGVALDRGLEVGLGWFRRGVPGLGVMVLHAGATLNHRAYLAALPDRQLGVAILANTDCALEPLARIAGNALRLLLEAKTGRPLPEREWAGEPVTPDLAVGIDDFVGRFDTLLGFAELSRKGDGLAVRLNGEALELASLGDGRFSIRGLDLGLFPKELAEAAFARGRIAGRDLLLWRNDDGRWQVVGEKLEPVPIPDAWHRRLGNYRILDPEGYNAEWSREGAIRALERDGLLLVEISRNGAMEQVLAIEPLADDTAVIRGYGSGKGATVRVVRDGGRERVLYSGLVLERTASPPGHRAAPIAEERETAPLE